MRLILLFTTLLAVTAFSQKIHTPAEVFEIMNKSAVSYSIEGLNHKVKAEDQSQNLTFNEFYREEKNGELIVKHYKYWPEVSHQFKLAEESYNKGALKEARAFYLKVLELDSSIYKVMTYIGQTYAEEGNTAEALKWYKKSIKKNFISYMSHWFLADLYYDLGKQDEAIIEITIAHILNRNNPRIQASMDKILKTKKIRRANWEFIPQIQIDSLSVKEISIKAKGAWMGYAMNKALWKYEPGYRESMIGSSNAFATTEEKECFVSLLTMLTKRDKKKDPSLQALDEAVKHNMTDEFIFYEIYLKQYPMIAYQLPLKMVRDISNYVLNVRSGIK